MTQNTLLINFFPKKCSSPGFSKFNLLIFLLFTSPSQYLWAILYPKSSFQQMPELSLTFLFFLIKLVPFGSSNIVIHVSSNDHFCAGFFSWAATSGCCLRKETRTKMANGLFPELIEFSCHHGWFHFSARPAYKYWVFLTSLHTAKRDFVIFMSISKCSIKSTVLDNIVWPTVGTGLWLTAGNIHNPFHRILDFCNSLIAVFDIESGWETFSRIMYMSM